MEIFRQVDYLWIFDPYINFKDRQNFELDDSSLTLADYSQMRLINRTLLTFFIQDINECGIEEAVKKFSETTQLELTD